MYKYLLSIIILLFSYSADAQQLEWGGFASYSRNNIVNSSNITSLRGIGNSYYDFNYGLSSVLYFNDPIRKSTFGLVLKYRRGNIATNSYEYDNTYLNTKTNSVSMLLRFATNKRYAHLSSRAYNRGSGEAVVYVDLGCAYSFVNQGDVFEGKVPQVDAFEKLSSDLDIKPNDMSIEFCLGVEKEMTKKMKIFLEINSTFGLLNINNNEDVLRSQNMSVSLGFRFMHKSKKRSCDCP